MLREILFWSALGVPVAAVLVAIAAIALSALGMGAAHPESARAVGFLLVQTLAPIAIWVGAEHVWRDLRERRLLHVLLFPGVVALIGWATTSASGDFRWPTDRLVLAMSFVGWLGFSWALLAAREVAKKLGVAS